MNKAAVQVAEEIIARQERAEEHNPSSTPGEWYRRKEMEDPAAHLARAYLEEFGADSYRLFDIDTGMSVLRVTDEYVQWSKALSYLTKAEVVRAMCLVMAESMSNGGDGELARLEVSKERNTGNENDFYERGDRFFRTALRECGADQLLRSVFKVLSA